MLVFVAYRYIKTPGWVFVSYLLLYAPMRYVLSEFRIDEETIGNLAVPQFVSLIIVGVGIILAGVLRSNPGPITEEWENRVFGPEELQELPETRRAVSPRLTVTLYGRPGCHLCDAAREMLRTLRAEFGFTLEDVNIEDDDTPAPALHV